MLPKVIDLFSGCGGLALGFEKAGFDITAGVELMPEAVKTVSANVDWRHGKKSAHICGDITKLEGDMFKDCYGEEGCIVIGGPPCQAYSIAGRGKLKSLGEHRVNTKDARGYLYQDFLRFVFGHNARAVIMENVPESTNYGGTNIPQHVCELLEEKGYHACWTILNSADYGVPQIRERVFVIAIKKSENKLLKLPQPTHSSYDETITYMQRRLEKFKTENNFRMPLRATEESHQWVTVGEAFSDLPILLKDCNAGYRLLPLNTEMPYRTECQNAYQNLMRSWYGTKIKSVTANAYRRNTRDFPIFERMKQGDNFIDACNIADELFVKTVRLYSIEEGTDEYEKLRKKMIPQSSREKFENKWKKLQESKPSHTLVAHLQKDTYSHLHPWEPRGISVREAARLQSFPDDFYFNCSMGDAFKQIGNAVPPLLAYGVAKSIYNIFKEE